jgi:hypothetical protein
MKRIDIQYHFTMEDGQCEHFNIQMDSDKMEVISACCDPLPLWTRLTTHQCPNCPLAPSEHPDCPPAVNMVEVVRRFDSLLSCDETTVSVQADERRIHTKTTVQRAVSSLLGLLMAASGCPMTVFFKPMARLHWPFASMDETLWRAISTYLLAQYFLHLDGGVADTRLEGLSQIYKEMQTVNMAFAKRLRTACYLDGMINGIILLDMFAQSMPDAIDETLAEIKHLFVPYLDQTDQPGPA